MFAQCPAFSITQNRLPWTSSCHAAEVFNAKAKSFSPDKINNGNGCCLISRRLIMLPKPDMTANDLRVNKRALSKKRTCSPVSMTETEATYFRNASMEKIILNNHLKISFRWALASSLFSLWML